jgi:glycosyltransferase involved in cell wall biosynthesis
MKVVISDLLTEQGSRSPGQLRRQRWIIKFVERFAPTSFVMAHNWESYRLADAVCAMTLWEKHLMTYLFGAPPEKIFIVANGMDELFLKPAPAADQRGKWLLCTATITARKRVLETAEAAVRAQTPLWIVGKPYSSSDPYAQQFYALAKKHPQLICCDSPPFDDREGLATIYCNARGFVLLSAMETRSLAAEEAAACECPLLLSDLPWARSTFGDSAQYCSIKKSTEHAAAVLRKFYDAAPSLPRPPKPPTWIGIAEQLKTIYERVLRS